MPLNRLITINYFYLLPQGYDTRQQEMGEKRFCKLESL